MARTNQEGTDQTQITQFKGCKRAVTPIIGIILLVAIAVILATIIGTFALGLGDRVKNYPPSTQFGFEFDSSDSGKSCGFANGANTGKLTIEHQSGDVINEEQTTLIDGDGNNAGWNNCASKTVSKITSGDITIPNIDSDDTIKLIWESENDADDTAILARYEGPDA